jgi:hypothetical protein
MSKRLAGAKLPAARLRACGPHEGSIWASGRVEISYTQTSVNRTVVDHYRCPESFAGFKLTSRLSDDTGYFRFGKDAICYGQSASGFRANRPDPTLYDVLEDVTTDGSTVCVPFNPSDVIDNLRLERYAGHDSYGALNRWKRSLRNAYYLLRPLMPVRVRRHFNEPTRAVGELSLFLAGRWTRLLKTCANNCCCCP